jgi:hypothetical protein
MEVQTDIRFGAAAVRAGMLTPEQFADAFARLMPSTGTEVVPETTSSLAHLLVILGWLSDGQVAGIWASLNSSTAVQPVALTPKNRRYHMEKPLGEGGMGAVTQVFDHALGRSVAMKQLAESQALDANSTAQLMDEATTAGRLEHPNIIPVYDAGFLPDNTPYYTMRLMDDMSLADVLDLLREGNVELTRQYPLTRLIRIFRQVCLAVDYAHSRGVVHRDIKPDNVRLGRYDEVQLADWGLARVEGSADRPLERALASAREGGDEDPCIVIGSPNYMSPEQAAGLNNQVGKPADIWALGAMLYEILTLDAPYDHADTMILLEKVERAELVQPSARAPDRVIPEEMERLCVAALQKNLDDRVDDVRVLHRSVSDWLEGARNREVADVRAFQHVQRGHRFGEAYARIRTARGRTGDRLRLAKDEIRRGQLGRELSALDLELATTWSQAYDAYTQAVAFTPQDLVARAKLAELAWNRIEDVEELGDPVACQFFWNILQRYNDGAWDPLLTGTAELNVVTRPPGATVQLRCYGTPADVGLADRAVGRTPQELAGLRAGLYLITVQMADYRTEVRPVFLRTGSPRLLQLPLSPV